MSLLNKRLAACCEYVAGSGIVCDIGTDHAYLPIHLLQSGKCGSAYACDIADGPLQSARANVSAQGFEKKITLIRSDGLDEVPLQGVSDIVIAGMGGELIFRILGRKISELGGINLILQPNTREAELVGWLYENGFEILAQRAVTDAGLIYIVINAVYKGEMRALSELERILGKLDVSDPEAARYIEIQADRLGKAAAGMLGSRSHEKREEGLAAQELAKKLRALIKA